MERGTRIGGQGDKDRQGERGVRMDRGARIDRGERVGMRKRQVGLEKTRNETWKGPVTRSQKKKD